MPTTASAQYHEVSSSNNGLAGLHLNTSSSLTHLDHMDMVGGGIHGHHHHHQQQLLPSHHQRGSVGSNLLETDSRAMQLAMELAMLQGTNSLDLSPTNGHHASSSSYNPADNPLLHPFGVNPGGGSISSSGNGMGGSLEDLNQRKSQNTTECVPVPTSEHVAEIVGRQGCKIKALRAKTNTYIKTPVRGEEPVFVVTGRKEDVALAKREILSAANHFSQIRASRSKNSGINSTLAFGQLVANQPGQTTTQVRVPYRVVGLVVGPKGATIKRIQQQTHTYIVTPSRDKEPVFEVTGLPENVEAARKEIEAHIALRTGNETGNGIGNIYGIGENNSSSSSSHDYNNVNGFTSAFSASNGHLENAGRSKFNSILTDSAFSSLSSSSNGKAGGMTIQNLLDSNNFGDLTSQSSSRSGLSAITAWSNGADSHDSGIGNSPPFDSNGQTSSNGGGIGASLLNGTAANNGTSIWGDLNKALGNMDLNLTGNSNMMMNGHDSNGFSKSFLNVGSRSSLDLGTLGRPSAANHLASGSNGSSNQGSSASSNHTATPPNPLLMSSGDASPPHSLPYTPSSGTSSSGTNGVFHHRASVSSEPNGLYNDASSCDMSASEAAASAAAAELAAFSSSMVLQENNSSASDKNHDDVASVGSN